MKIVGTVILYNPDSQLSERINSYLPFVEQLYVIDNSDKQNESFFNDILDINKLIYVWNESNLGIAEALNIALQMAYKNNADWLLTMDQDSSFSLESISIYFQSVKEFININQVGIFAPNYNYHGNPSSNNFSDEQIVITSGSLINLAISKYIGDFDNNLFIDEVDHDYCLRIIKHGYRVVMFREIDLIHKLGNQITIKNIFGNPIKIMGHSPLRNYYQVRNVLYMRKKHHLNFNKITKSRVKSVKKHIRQNILYGDHKIERIKFVILAIKDFLFNNMGKLL